VGSEQRVIAELSYGVKYLGIYIGSDTASLEIVLRKQAEEIMAYAVGNAHRAFHLLQKSLAKSSATTNGWKPRYHWSIQSQIF
jgi:hypothetical protein